MGGIRIAKWADYCISAVKYDDRHTKIIATEVSEDLGESIGQGKRWARSEVVTALDAGRSFITIRKTNEGKWSKGAEVHIVTINGTKYIRTDRNTVEVDNFGELPEL